MKKLTIHRFYFDAITRARKYRERYGQAMFNHLCEVRPDLSEKVRGTDMDPFYCRTPDDAKFDRFIDFIESNWQSGREEFRSPFQPGVMVEIVSDDGDVLNDPPVGTLLEIVAPPLTIHSDEIRDRFQSGGCVFVNWDAQASEASNSSAYPMSVSSLKLCGEKYRFRNVPANEAEANADGRLLCIMGEEFDSFGKWVGGGVLEWCTSKSDAENLINEMRKDPSLSDLSIEWF